MKHFTDKRKLIEFILYRVVPTIASHWWDILRLKKHLFIAIPIGATYLLSLIEELHVLGKSNRISAHEIEVANLFERHTRQIHQRPWRSFTATSVE